MRLRTMTFVTLVALLAFAPQAFAWSSGGKGRHDRSGSDSFAAAGPSSSSTTLTTGGGTASSGGGVMSTPEPLATLLVGLGLLGARYLRRT